MNYYLKWGLIGILAFIGLFVWAVILSFSTRKNFLINILLVTILILIIFLMIKIFLQILNPHKKLKHHKIRKNRISSEFKEIYNYVKTEYGKELETDRKKFLLKLIITIVFYIIAVILSIFIIMKTKYEIYTQLIAILFMPSYLFYYNKCQKFNKIYVRNYKKRIIKNFIECINPNLYYDQNAITSLMDKYYESGFEDGDYEHFYEDDYINGYSEKGTKVEISNITLGKSNKKREFFEIVYEGIFSITYLKYDVAEELRIKKNEYKIKYDKNKVQMDSREFEKYFDVYTNSNILAMKLLTHDVMEVMVKFYEEFKIKFEIIIKNSKIYIRFDTGMMFEPNIIRKSYDIKTLWVYYNILKFIINFTIRLNVLLKDSEV